MRSKTVFMLAIIMGIFTSVLFFQYIQQAGKVQEVSATVETVKVIAAIDVIPENQIITAEMLKEVEVMKGDVHPNTVLEMDEVTGKYSITLIEQGEILLTHRFQSSKEEQQFVSRKVSDGYRAVSIGADFVRSVSNLIEPEDYIDVILSVQNDNEIKSEIILSDVRVLAVGRKMTPPTFGDEYIEYSSITLELQPRDATVLINSSERGSLHFILHSRIIPADTSE